MSLPDLVNLDMVTENPKEYEDTHNKFISGNCKTEFKKIAVYIFCKVLN